MALPVAFKIPNDYFEECLIFFKKYEHLFNIPNTDLLLSNVLDKIDLDVLEKDNVFDNNVDLMNVQNDYLIDFFQHINKLKVEYEEVENIDVEFLINVPISSKKKHEIVNLSREIESLCKDTKCDTVVDFGSGLGYLDQQIFKTTGMKVLGLECSETNYIAAKKRQNKYHNDSTNSVKFIKHEITEESHINITNYLEDKFLSFDRFCIAGLHACADLTIDAMNIFLKMEKAQALIVMPCCYHRIFQINTQFKNFPLSTCLKKIHEKYNEVDFLSVPFLRLATQPPDQCKEKIGDLVFNLLARAVLQVYCHKHNCKLKRNKRKAIRLKTIENNFEAYIKNASTGFKIIPNNENEENVQTEEFDMDELRKMWREINDVTLRKTAIFILLQNYLQPILENFVLYDRLLYLQENHVKNCRFKKIVNESISPRCLALIAKK